MRTRILPVLAAFAVGVPAVAAGQQERGTPLTVGTAAPDFEIPGATRYGTLQDPIRLSDYHGKTIILAFFYRARSRG